MYMSFSTIFLLMCFIIFAAVAIVLCVNGAAAMRDGNESSSKACFAFCISTAFSSILIATSLAGSIRIDQTETCIQNGYTFYIDGEEVDETKINVNDYEATINNELQEVYLSTQ